jgi:hypothetical protein
MTVKLSQVKEHIMKGDMGWVCSMHAINDKAYEFYPENLKGRDSL